MRLTLPLGHRPLRRVPGIGAQTRGIVDGQPEVVADLGAGAALGQVFVKSLAPRAGEIDLRQRGGADSTTAASASHDGVKASARMSTTSPADPAAAGT